MELTLTDFVRFVLFASLFSLVIFATVSRFLHWNHERKLKRMVMVCRLCGHVFLNRENVELIECDACHSMNRRNGNGKLG